jgi:hypothetical protein
MKALLMALTLFVSGNALANNGSANVSDLLGWGLGQGATWQDIKPAFTTSIQNPLNFFVLDTAYLNTANHFKAWYKQGVQYQVPGGVTAKCVLLYGMTAAANTSYQLAYDTAAFVQDAAALSGGAVYQAGAANVYTYTFYSNIWNQHSIKFDFPANSYPALQVGNGDSSGQHMVCREI